MKKRKEILIIGQLTLHWGRLEFGNMGNYYIIEPFFRELHRVFPDFVLKTTFQLTKQFCERENVIVLPMELYYGFVADDLEKAQDELQHAEKYLQNGDKRDLTPYIQEVLSSELVIDFSGDMWSDNADLVGNNRFMCGVIKDRIAQMFVPVFMLAGSPGPFNTVANIDFAREVYQKFRLVTNREKISRKILCDYGFDVTNTEEFVCPSFLFEQGSCEEIVFDVLKKKTGESERPMVGMILCGWNFESPPFSKWPREDAEYENFLKIGKYVTEELNANLVLLSHSNGFPIPPEEFKLMHGRDFFVVEHLKELLDKKDIKHVYLLSDVLNAWKTKQVIGKFDMLISGRIHGAVAAFSQAVPTVILDYGHEPKAHKQLGIAKLVGMERFLADPSDYRHMKECVRECWNHRDEIRKSLETKIKLVKDNARKQFDRVAELYREG